MEDKKAIVPKKWWERSIWLERLYGGWTLFNLLFLWVTGSAIWPATIWRLLVNRDPTLVYLLIPYYSYRYFKPAKEWLALQRINRPGAKYFRKQAIVLDGFKPEDIPENSGHLFAFHPHVREGRDTIAKLLGVTASPHGSSIIIIAPPTPTPYPNVDGILTIGYSLANMSPLLNASKIKYLVTDAMMQMPLIADWLSWNGCAIASKQYMQARMKKNVNMALLPGGFEESTLYKRGAYRVYIKKRAGFIKYCLEAGYSVHPTFVFGEEYTYHAYTGNIEARLKLNKHKLPGVLFTSILGLMPYWGQDLHVVIGPAIKLPKIDKPSEEDVQKWHGIYISKLQELFEKHKHAYCPNPAEAKLEIW